jgi:hypothetical protein
LLTIYKDVPEKIECFICQANEKEQFIFDKSELEIVEFYQLIER